MRIMAQENLMCSSRPTHCFFLFFFSFFVFRVSFFFSFFFVFFPSFLFFLFLHIFLFSVRPHVYIVDAQLSLCTDVDCQCCTSTDPDLVVTAPLSQDKKQSSSWSSHVAELVDLHTM